MKFRPPSENKRRSLSILALLILFSLAVGRASAEDNSPAGPVIDNPLKHFDSRNIAKVGVCEDWPVVQSKYVERLNFSVKDTRTLFRNTQDGAPVWVRKNRFVALRQFHVIFFDRHDRAVAYVLFNSTINPSAVFPGTIERKDGRDFIVPKVHIPFSANSYGFQVSSTAFATIFELGKKAGYVDAHGNLGDLEF